MSAKTDARYTGNASLAYNRPPPVQERRRSPSPGPPGAYPPYDRYAPERISPVYREGYGNNYRQDSWRQDRPYYNPPYGGSPSPDRYGPPRSAEQESWVRPSWRSPDMQNWTESRIGRPSPYENNRDYDRHPDLPVGDQSPERPFRTNAPQPYSPHERFRRYPPAQEYRDPYPYAHTRSDSYRSYVDRGPWEPAYYPDEYSPSYEPNVRSTSYGRYSGRSRRRTRSVSGGSVQDGAPSPIRTRTNLPDRTQVPARSPSTYSRDSSMKHVDSYAVSPFSRTRSRSRSSSRSSRSQRSERPAGLAASQIQTMQYLDASIMAADANGILPHPSEEAVSPPPGSPSPAGTAEEPPDMPIHEHNHVAHEDAVTVVENTAETLSTQNLEKHSVPDTTTIIDISLRSKPQPLPPIQTQAIEPVESVQISQDASPEPDIPLAVQHRRSSASNAPSPAEASFGENMLSRPETPPGEPIPLSEALRMIVAVRLQQDRQTQEERVDPILQDNLSKVERLPTPEPTSPEAVVQEVGSPSRTKQREETFFSHKPSLEVRFAQRQTDLNEKVHYLKEQYLELHERWLVQCGKLDEVARQIALQEAAATAGRTTRRSAASMGDAVRSDLEMEQIIASLGNEELTDANHLGARNAAKIPDMITVTSGEVEYLYDDTNNEVENPSEFYVPHTHAEDWTDEEITTLVEKFAEFPKQFGIIADFLPNKTAAECVAFYYLHKHKHIDFRKVVARRAASKRRRGGRKQKSNALLTDIMKHDDEVHASSGSGKRRRTVPLPGEPRKGRRNAHDKQTPTATPTPEPDGDTRKRKRRTTTKAAVAAEQDEGNDDGDVDPKPAKRTRRTRKPRTTSATPAGTPAIPDEGSATGATKFVDQTEVTAKRKAGSTNWSEDDRVAALFLRLLAQYGDDFKRIASSMPNKTTIQVSTFYKANAVAMDLESIVRSAPKRSPSPENESWADGLLPGSGAVTPSVSSTSTPAESYTGANYNGYPFEPHYHMNVPCALN
ncbi:hypothetical protein NM688_g5342 [Phlebia brevispora]|uniref:Uncharacterized protein n=1 Tax=Phlebia brevispora TaxID=194682 RepID=A0ACC1SX71_9APHY|nr:hypothetical protein NM688_g5342 [Phlebia brevispora]